MILELSLFGGLQLFWRGTHGGLVPQIYALGCYHPHDGDPGEREGPVIFGNTHLELPLSMSPNELPEEMLGLLLYRLQLVDLAWEKVLASRNMHSLGSSSSVTALFAFFWQTGIRKPAGFLGWWNAMA